MQEYTGGYSVPLRERSDYEAAGKGLLDIARRLGDYLRSKPPSDDMKKEMSL